MYRCVWVFFSNFVPKTHRFLRYSTCKYILSLFFYCDLESRVRGHLRSSKFIRASNRSRMVVVTTSLAISVCLSVCMSVLWACSWNKSTDWLIEWLISTQPIPPPPVTITSDLQEPRSELRHARCLKNIMCSKYRDPVAYNPFGLIVWKKYNLITIKYDPVMMTSWP